MLLIFSLVAFGALAGLLWFLVEERPYRIDTRRDVQPLDFTRWRR